MMQSILYSMQGEEVIYVKGDATCPIGEGEKVIVHICNTLGTWGKGFVLALSKRWPAPEHHFKQLKSYTLGEIQLVRVEKDVEVVNMIAQKGIKKFYDSKGQRYVDYDALVKCLTQVRGIAEGKSVHMPRIGVGLGGGSWGVISDIIKQTLCSKGVKVYVYDL